MATKKATSVAVKQPRMSAEEKRWQAQDDLRTMQRAAEISSDQQRMKAAQSEAQKQIKALQKVGKS